MFLVELLYGVLCALLCNRLLAVLIMGVKGNMDKYYGKRYNGSVGCNESKNLIHVSVHLKESQTSVIC